MLNRRSVVPLLLAVPFLASLGFRAEVVSGFSQTALGPPEGGHYVLNGLPCDSSQRSSRSVQSQLQQAHGSVPF